MGAAVSLKGFLDDLETLLFLSPVTEREGGGEEYGLKGENVSSHMKVMITRHLWSAYDKVST